MADTTLNARVDKKMEVAPGLMIVRVVPEGWTLPEFKAGQFAVLGLPGSAPRCAMSEPEEKEPSPERLIRRAYSIASSSVQKEYLEFYVALVRSGSLTPRLFALDEDDRVFLSPKITGMFTLDEVPDDSNVMLVATGTGIAPYMSMIRSRMLAHEDRRFAVLHGARHSWDLGYRSELVALERHYENFIYLPTIRNPVDEGTPWMGHVGFVQTLWTDGTLEKAWGGLPAPADTHVFLCGNPGMIESMTDILQTEGFKTHTRKDPGQIHMEKYW